MSEAPERIWAGMVTTQHYPLVIQRLWDVERFGDKTGYVRVDLYEQLQAEVERLREQLTCVWDHNAVTENYPCGCCGYPNGLKDARRIPPPPQEQSE